MLQATLLAMSLAVAQVPTTPPATPPAPTLELDPPQVMVQPGEPFRLKAKTNASRAFFDAESLRAAPEDWPLADRKTCYYGFAPTANGTYPITVTVYANDERIIRKCLVIVGQQPQPPGPRPGPDPNPPSDPLFAELQKLYTADSSPQKAAHVATLAGLFRTAGQAALRDDTVKTTGQLCAKLKNAAGLLLPADAIKAIREKLGADCLSALGKTDAPLTDASRDAAKLLFDRVAGLLENLH